MNVVIIIAAVYPQARASIVPKMMTPTANEPNVKNAPIKLFQNIALVWPVAWNTEPLELPRIWNGILNAIILKHGTDCPHWSPKNSRISSSAQKYNKAHSRTPTKAKKRRICVYFCCI